MEPTTGEPEPKKLQPVSVEVPEETSTTGGLGVGSSEPAAHQQAGRGEGGRGSELPATVRPLEEGEGGTGPDGEAGAGEPALSVTQVEVDILSRPRIVTDGLKLKLERQTTPIRRSFSYALFPTLERSSPVDWQYLVTEHQETQNIRLHPLQPNENLLELLNDFRKSYAKAVVLINTEDSYELPAELVASVKEVQFPVLIVKRSDGEEILRYVDDEEVYARVDAENQVDEVDQVPGGVVGGGHVAAATPQKKTSVESSITLTQKFKAKLGFHSKQVADLKAEIKRLMFTADKMPVSMVKDSSKFSMIMSAFNNYEKVAKRETHSDLNDVMKRLKIHMIPLLKADFPFYILLVYRMHKKMHKYECDDTRMLIVSFFNDFESKLSPARVANQLLAFLKLGDFSMQFNPDGDEERTSSVFNIMEQACMELAEVSYKLHNSSIVDAPPLSNGHRPLFKNFLYSRMLWVSMAMKLREARRVQLTRNVTQKWRDHLVKFRHRLVFDSEVITELEDGLELGRLLELPFDLSCNHQHLADLFAAEGIVRPFSHLTRCVKVAEKHISDWKHLEVLLTELRAVYDSHLVQQNNGKFKSVSRDGTLMGCVVEGINFLDQMYTLLTNRNDVSQNLLDSQLQSWLQLLLRLVDIRGDDPSMYLKFFVQGKQPVMKKYRLSSQKYIIQATRDQFPNLSIQQFYQLYRAFKIWSNQFLQEFLKVYSIPPDICLSDATWKDFFAEVVGRFQSARLHYYLSEFLKAVAQKYREAKKAVSFLLDLLKLDVSRLLSVEGDTERPEESQEVRTSFSMFLHDYINRNALKHSLLSKMTSILASISNKRDEFQLLVLDVLRREVVPEMKAIHQGTDSNFKTLLNESVRLLRNDLGWLTSLSTKQRFCWGILTTCCSKINISLENFDWVHHYCSIFPGDTKLGVIFSTYCTGRKLPDDKRIIATSLPDEIRTHPSEDLRKYFEWVAEIQHALQYWSNKFQLQNINYGEVLLYASHYVKVAALGQSLCASSLVVDASSVQQVKTTFLQDFELLNALLLRYIPGIPDAKWCYLPSLLEEYGVCLPQRDQEMLNSRVGYPGGHQPDVRGTPLHPSTSGIFLPGHDISLTLHKNVTLKELSGIVRSVDKFQVPLTEHLRMLVFFKLSKSMLFDKYLRYFLKQITDSVQMPQATLSRMQFADFGFSIGVPSASFTPPSTKQAPSQGLPMTNLVHALRQTSDLMDKIMRGTATYSEIIAEDKLILQQLEIEREFAILSDYVQVSNLSSDHCKGLDGIQSMLELFQYTTHIKNIRSVCVQYHLKCALDDPLLQELTEIMADHVTEEDRSRMTPIIASEKMRRVKEILCLEGKTSSKCLDIFAAMTDSAAFYQFVRDKQFYGQQGQATFSQQYQLITAQLQHEEYDEQVLNHLFAAFKVISPFMDSKKDFTQLMREVTVLNAVNGLKQLETVNANITLIRLWFSRAEGDTLQNVAKELEAIINTGTFTFQLDGGEDNKGQVFLEYEPASIQFPSHTPSPPAEGEEQARLVRLESQAEAGKGRRERWNSEQIRDFVRKLGFMDKEKEEAGGDKIKNFLHLNQTIVKLFELYVKLRELGHPQYLTDDAILPMYCSSLKDQVDTMVQETRLKLTKWTQQVSELRSSYKWLLYFSVPRMLQLHQLVHCAALGQAEMVDRIVHEVSFLTVSQPREVERLRQGVMQALADTARPDTPPQSPMQVVGQFLNHLLQDHTLPRRCSAKDNLGSLPRHHRSVTSYQYIAQPLYYCPVLTYSQMDFLCLILNVFSGIPESYQVLRCQATTTEEELSLFLKRVEQYHAHYLMLDVNKLPFKLQEYLVQVHLAIQRSRLQVDTSIQEIPSTIHFVETAPSMLREMPWIQLKDSKDYRLSLEEAKKLCTSIVARSPDFACIQLVYGSAGNGKTHYIQKQLANCSEHITIAVNEAFSPLRAISKLRSLPLYASNVGLFFNFTILPPGESVAESERTRYRELMDVIGWFFFDLFLLGFVEDPTTGQSFRLPGGLQWAVFIEVPSRDKDSAGEALKLFHREVPALQLLGSPHYIHPEIPYTVDSDVQLVCKYLRAYKATLAHNPRGIDKPYREGGQLVKFSQDPDLSDEDCHGLLQEYMPKHIQPTKITQRLFIKYMKRRCDFLDRLPAFNYNTGSGEYLTNEYGVKTATNTEHLGSTLMHTMLNEVSDFCDPSIKENWSLKAHQQLIYDFKDGGASLGLISLHPNHLRESEKAKFTRIGVKIPSMTDLYSRELLDSYLSRALNVELENGRLTVVDDSAYVLTLDYTIKMLNIHERYMCGVPVIIEGETGVGKTALVEMLSRLWNQSLLLEWKRHKSCVLEFFQKKLGDVPNDIISENYQACLQAVEAMCSGDVTVEALQLLCNHADGTHGQLYSQLTNYLAPMRNDPVVPLLAFKEPQIRSLEELFADLDSDGGPDATARLLQAVLKAQVAPTFHKINVHAAMTPAEIKKLFEPVFEQAKLLRDTYQRKVERVKAREEKVREENLAKRRESSVSRRSVASSIASSISSTTTSDPDVIPFVTVFLDEVNTSSCLGLFKEIIVDRCFDGEPIPDNVFIVAACNPHRGNSLASHRETWVRGTYYVRSLHPTLKFLMWDYGSLDEHQERDYINAKMKMLNRTMANPEIASLTDLVVTSQKQMRDFAFRQLKDTLKVKNTQTLELAHISSRSCVSQRDIQRVFTFYQWFKGMYDKQKPHGERSDYHRRAVLVALGLVYYMRLNAEFRKEYRKYLDEINRLPNEVSFSRAFEEELAYYIGQVELPKGIARTLALQENLFATIICTVTHTPLIIVGAPGSSKTLSFNQTIANLKGQESKRALFRNTDIFHSLDPHYYQCSRRTTSHEIQTVFSRAINRQRSHQRFNLPIYCVVFMDEAGLPEESHESLKVLHYHLDRQEVSFVAITNHVLDAAKTNRAVSLFRPEASDEDLETLAKGCLCSDLENPPPELRRDLDMVVKFCQPYSECMKSAKFSSFFGLRDFIQFVNYLRRKRDEGQPLSPQLVMQALERNFNGSDEFESICRKFLQAIKMRYEDMLSQQRHILEVLRESMQDRPQAMQDLTENEVRYKLIIDPSEDDSLVRLLFSAGVMERKNTRLFVCSDFPGDGQLQKINTIAAIRHSAIEGHTAVLSQTDDIHESFYDLFNQRFRRIDDPEHGARYYTNIAIGAHLKPSRVDPNFQCVVVVKKSEVDSTPAPFLNRFEKYLISHHSLLETILRAMPPCVAVMVEAAREKVNEFQCRVYGIKSLYGLQPETLDSLILDLLPPLGHAYNPLGEDSLVDDSQDVAIYLLQEILNALRGNAGFQIPRYPLFELRQDAAHIFGLVTCDPKFEGLLHNLTHQEAMQAVTEAFNLLHSAPGHQGEGGQLDLTPEGCLVVSLLQQVLVRLLTKRLMNLMTTEAVVLNRNKIPYTYLEHYLSNQAHFSLKEAIKNYHGAFKATIMDPHKSPNKLVCFTRSSPLVHTLPAQFPCPAQSELDAEPDTIETTVANLVFEDTDKLVVHKLSNLLSQSSVQELFREFISSEEAEVCVLLANMQETSCKTINHIRVMIEEAELRTREQHCKMFVLLLHFPPAQFFQHCYPALFLKGWDHAYLDTLAHSTVRGVVDIQDWFFKCCFPAEDMNPDEPDTLLQALSQILPQAISVISARVYFGNKHDRSFNSAMNATQRSNALRTLLFDQGLGDVLCEKFRAYWKPKLMAEYLEKAATFSKQRESTLNITDSIQTQVKTLFMDFCVYMLSRANENFNLDVIYAEESSSAIHKLFLQVFRIFPVPKLSQLNLLSNNLPALQPPSHCPRFPFFSLIYALMEKQVELSVEAANLQLGILTDHAHQERPVDSLASPPPSNNPGAKLEAMIEAVLTDLEPQLNAQPQQVLSLAISAMSANLDLWNFYFNDFITHKLKLVDLGHTPQSHTLQGDFAQQILCTYLEELHVHEAPRRMAQLHCYVGTYQLQLAQMAAILRPLSKIERLQDAQVMSATSPLSPAQQLLNAVRQTRYPLGSPAYLSNFIITTLFNSLMSATSLPSTNPAAAPPRSMLLRRQPNKLRIWFNSYRDIMSLSVLRQSIYYSLCMPEVVAADNSVLMEAMLNLMQATFVTLQSGPSLDEETLFKGRQTFHTLFTRYFKESAELKTPSVSPGLAGTLEVVVEVVSSSDFTPSLHRGNAAVRLVMEGLLSHFFSPHRPTYQRDDVLWFLRLANEQGQWCYNPFQEDEEEEWVEPEKQPEVMEISVGVVAGGLEDDLISKLEESQIIAETKASAEVDLQLPAGAMEMSMFKFYLGRILGTYTEQPDSEESGPLLLYQQKFRRLVGEVLAQGANIGPPGPYIPLFYQIGLDSTTRKFAENNRMQQALCHLYFLTVIEHLWSEHQYKSHSKLSIFVRAASNVQKQLETAEGGEAILLWVELQAVVQVLIQELAVHLNPAQTYRLGDVQLILKDINNILDNPAMGGGVALGHGLVLSLHLIKLLKSSRKFADLMTSKYDSLKDIGCLKPIHLQLQAPKELQPHLFPFLRPGTEGDLTSLYKRVVAAMLSVHGGAQEPTELVAIAQSCIGGEGSADLRRDFRMVLWLATYYSFYCNKIVSPLLCNVVGGQDMSNYLREEGYIRLIQCFLHPSLMLERKESPNSLTENEVLELGPDGKPRVIQRGGTLVDPIYQLFMPSNPDDIDQSDIDLRHSLANLIAVVLGSPSRSNHLWFHMFGADRLQDTYMTGFMYDATVRPDGLLYDCGVELSPEGQFGRQDYKKHACRGTYTLHSLYLLLWANFGCFCVTLLTQPDSDQRIHGKIISEWLSLRHYCVSQLKTLWLHLRNNLGLTDEQRAFFVMRAMDRLRQVLSVQSRPPPSSVMDTVTPDVLKGVFRTRQELDAYEKFWHTSIYQPTWDEQAIKFVEYSSQQQNNLFNEIRRLEVRYPHFPSERELTNCVLSSGDLQQHSEGGRLRLLARFTMEQPHLYRGGLLLPDLVELYDWLHMNIAHLLTYDQASSVTIGHVIRLAERNSSKELGDHIRNLYERVKINYNLYVDLIGGAIGAGACAAVRRGNKIFTISDDIPLLHFLTDVEEEEQGNDWLYLVIADIIANHNHTIEGLYSILQGQGHSRLSRLLPEEPAKILPTEVTQSSAIVSGFTELHGINSFLQMMRSRYQPTSQDTPMLASSTLVSLSWHSINPRQQVPAFQLEQLEEDFVLTFITGKPLIDSASLLRKVFKFKKDQKQELGNSQDCMYTAHDLQDMSDRLPENFKAPLPDALMKRVEYEFHSANYHLMMEVLTALRTVTGHLVKALEDQRTDYGDLRAQTAPEFMLNLYEHLTRHSDVLHEIGVQSASPSHLRCLADLPLTATYSCLRLFFRWVDEGFYDFCAVPFPFKVHLGYKDQQAIEQLRVRWSCTVPELLKELQQLIDVLKHSEQDITRRVNEAVNKPILDYLIEYHMLQENEDLITSYIPRTIMLHHYVEFRLALRRLQLKVQQELADTAKGEGTVDIWLEFVNDLWDKYLPHLREELYGEGLFVYNPNTGCYGFQEEEGEEEDTTNSSALMAALLREAAEEDWEEERQGDDDSFRLQPEEEESFAVVPEGSHTYDLDQLSSDEEGRAVLETEVQESSPQRRDEEGREGAVSGDTGASVLPGDLEERLKTDPELKKRLLSIVQGKDLAEDTCSVESLARRLTVEDIAKFLTEIGLPQYVDKFKSSDITGELLLEADPEILAELGVASPLHQMKIMQLFRRQLQGSVARFSQHHMTQFLQHYKLEKYTPTLEGHGIDGDMILEVEEKLMKSVLREVGVTSLVDILKIRSKYKTYISDEA